MSEEDVFDGAFEADDAPVIEAPKAAEIPAPEPESTPEPTPEPAPPEPVAQPEPKPEPQEPMVPLKALLAERDKVRMQEQRPAPQPAEPQAIPDPYEDPAGFQQYTQAVVEQRSWQQLCNISELMAVKEYGADKVKEATDAFLADAANQPWLQAELRAQAHPAEYVVKRHQRNQLLSRIDPNDLDQFTQWKAAQAANPVPAPAFVAAAPSQPAARPPPSLASAPSAGGMGIIADEDPFEAEFKRKKG